jgi:hypothetical protein
MLWTHYKNKDTTLQKVLNIKLKEYRERPRSRWEHQVRKYVTQNKTKKEHGKELRCSSGMKERSVKKFGYYMTHTKRRCLKKVIS